MLRSGSIRTFLSLSMRRVIRTRVSSIDYVAKGRWEWRYRTREPRGQDFIPLPAPEMVPARVGGIGGEVIIRIRRALCKPSRQLCESLRQQQLCTTKEIRHLRVQQIIPHDVPDASRVQGKGGVSRRLKLHQRRVLVSKELGDILRVRKRSDGVKLFHVTVHQQSPGSRRDQNRPCFR